MITWETEKKNLSFLQFSQVFLSVSKILMQNFRKLFSFSRHHTLSTTYAYAPAYITNHGQPTYIRETQSRKNQMNSRCRMHSKGNDLVNRARTTRASAGRDGYRFTARNRDEMPKNFYKNRCFRVISPK